LEQAEVKARALGDNVLARTRDNPGPKDGENANNSEESDEDDFEEVADKVDYEVSAQDDRLLEMVFLRSEQDHPRPGSSKPRQEQKKQKPLFMSEENDPSDPTTFAASLKKMGHIEGPKTDVEEDGEVAMQKKKVRDDVPVVPFDVDLMDWGEDVKPRKVLRQTDSHRFWGSAFAGADDEVVVPGSSNRERSIDFSGKFEEIKWSCRAPLPSGNLCPRRDKKKCPLHGPVIARDRETGKPSDPSNREKPKNTGDGNQDNWDDPELLRDIEGATGHDLGSSKGKGKGRGKRTGLTNIEQEKQNTTRKRLEKKIFNKSSMKRVAASLNIADSKRSKDKFADQFNYIYNK